MIEDLETYPVSIGSLKGCSRKSCGRKAKESATLEGRVVYYCDYHRRIGQIKLLALKEGLKGLVIEKLPDSAYYGCDRLNCDSDALYKMDDGTGALYACSEHAVEAVKVYESADDETWGGGGSI